MTYSATILADSIAPNGVRLTTMEWTYPRFIHSEIMTHRMLSRNAASSRAIPAKKLRAAISEQPVIPLSWVREQPGMVGAQAFDPESREALEAESIWLEARDDMLRASDALSALGIHKSIPNRLIEPFMWITVIITATDWNNLWHLRVAPDAEQHFNHIASRAKEVYDHPITPPQQINYADPCPWHLPLIRWDDREEWAIGERTCGKCKGKGYVEGGYDTEYCDAGCKGGIFPFTTMDLVRVSVGRCARVSYLTHDGKRDLGEDIRLHDQLMNNGHWSPFEHVATPLPEDRIGGTKWSEHRSGNLRGWTQYRKLFSNEYVRG